MISKQDCFDKLEEISELKENWNGYGAKSIDKDLINECWYIVNQLFVCPEIFPTADNSIQLEYDSDEAYIEIEIFSDKYILFCEVNKKCVSTELGSKYQAIDWWNVLTAMVKMQQKRGTINGYELF